MFRLYVYGYLKKLVNLLSKIKQLIIYSIYLIDTIYLNTNFNCIIVFNSLEWYLM